ncbi:MAG: hypothetical protein K5679_05800 [Lachnospiraceae bacterium]|nr:hypothetical protein [Lachnospiraceae bacterium]
MSKKVYEGQLDFLGLLNEYTDSQGATVRVREPGNSRLKPVDKSASKFKVSEAEPEQLKIDFETVPEPAKEETAKAEPAKAEKQKPSVPKEPKPATKPKPAKPAEVAESKPEPAEPVSTGNGSKEILFKQCKKCWCFDCKHNSRNEGIARDLCGTMMPCPACETCIAEEQATICEIGNAKEGCKLRAQEEGILTEEESVY